MKAPSAAAARATESAVRLGVLLPDLLGTYGDGGNAVVLAHRLLARGYDVEVREVHAGEPVPTGCDIYLLGGGEDTAQVHAAEVLRGSAFPRAVGNGAVVLAVCAGYQILGALTPNPGATSSARAFGLGLLDVSTAPGPHRAVGEVLARLSPAALADGTSDVATRREEPDRLLTGFENHRGRTTIGPDAQPLGHIAGRVGTGNGDGSEGVVQGTIVGTYLHGPVLARNPLLADYLLALATGDRLRPLCLAEVADLRRHSIARARLQQRPLRRLRRTVNTVIPHGWAHPGIPRPPAPHR